MSGVTDDGRAVMELALVSNISFPHLVMHFVYAPTREAAVVISDNLQARGFDIESRLSSDCENWLVLARHVVIPSESYMNVIRQTMNSVVAMVGGEYDGWEVEVP